MSTDYRPLTPIRMADLFDGRLEKLGVQEQHSDEATPNSKCLTDGRNFLWFYGNEEGLASAFTRYGDNAPQRILRAISQEFNVKLYPSTHRNIGDSATKKKKQLFGGSKMRKVNGNSTMRWSSLSADRITTSSPARLG